MSNGEIKGELKIERHELFERSVDQALASERAGRARIIADPPPVSPLRRLLLNPLVYLPLAAVLGALATWFLLEPEITDLPVEHYEAQAVAASISFAARCSRTCACASWATAAILSSNTRVEAASSSTATAVDKSPLT